MAGVWGAAETVLNPATIQTDAPMNFTDMLFAALLLLSAIGLATWGWVAVARIGDSVKTLVGVPKRARPQQKPRAPRPQHRSSRHASSGLMAR